MKHLSILIKPASGMCNMQCKYCFYYDVMENRKIANHGFMTDKTLETIVKKAYLANPLAVSFVFQGGEPLLCGISFYEKFITFVKKYNLSNLPTTYALQTNGTLITTQFASFFKANNFLIGISLDGYEQIHNYYRVMNDTSNAFKKTLAGLAILKEYQVDYNLLTVITNETANNVEKTYHFLKTLGTDYLQFIPCIDSFDSQVKGQYLSNEAYLKFLKELFDLWYLDYKNKKIISIRYFDDILKIIIGYYPESCTLQGKCINQNVIEADGSVYPCDFYVIDQWKTGNITKETFTELDNSKNAIKFIASSMEENEDCMKCKYYQLCRGGCRRNKELLNGETATKTRFCETIYAFFDYSIQRFIEIGNDLAKLS